MSKHLFLPILAVLFFCSCDHSKEKVTASEYETVVKTYSLNLSVDDGNAPFQNTPYTYIHLSGEPKNKRISSVEKILLVGDKIIVKDRINVNIYNKSGQYICSAGNVGKANNEYIELCDISVRNEYLYVLDGGNNKLLCFSLDGNFISSHKLPLEDLTGVAATDSGFMLYRPLYSSDDNRPEYKYALTNIDTAMNIRGQEITYNQYSPNINNGSPFVENEESVFFNQFLTNNFSLINRNKGIVQTYSIDFGAENISDNDIKEPDGIFTDNSNKRFLTATPFFYKNYLIIKSVKNRGENIHCIDTATTQIFDIGAVMNIRPSCIGLDHDSLYFPYEFNADNASDSMKTAYENGENLILKVELPN